MAAELYVWRPSLLIRSDRLDSAHPPRSHLRACVATPEVEKHQESSLKSERIGIWLSARCFLCLRQMVQPCRQNNQLVLSCVRCVCCPAFRDLASTLLWLENILGPSDSIRATTMLLLSKQPGSRRRPSRPYCPMWERVGRPCYANKNILQPYFTRGCARERVSLFVQMACAVTGGLQWLRDNVRAEEWRSEESLSQAVSKMFSKRSFITWIQDYQYNCVGLYKPPSVRPGWSVSPAVLSCFGRRTANMSLVTRFRFLNINVKVQSD